MSKLTRPQLQVLRQIKHGAVIARTVFYIDMVVQPDRGIDYGTFLAPTRGTINALDKRNLVRWVRPQHPEVVRQTIYRQELVLTDAGREACPN